MLTQLIGAVKAAVFAAGEQSESFPDEVRAKAFAAGADHRVRRLTLNIQSKIEGMK